MSKNIFVYLHHYDAPRYVGEGTWGRAQSTTRRGKGAYPKFSRAHKNDHKCVMILGAFDNKVSARLLEQGMISWLGMRLRGQGTLLNGVPFTDGTGLPGPLPEEVEMERRRKIKEHPVPKEKVEKGIVSRRNNGRPWHTDETRAKMSESQRGKEVSQEVRDKISLSLTGQNQSEETKEKRAASLRESYKNRTSALSKQVRVVFNDGTVSIFKSQTEAGLFFGVTAQGIARMIKTGKTRLKIQHIGLA